MLWLKLGARHNFASAMEGRIYRLLTYAALRLLNRLFKESGAILAGYILPGFQPGFPKGQ